GFARAGRTHDRDVFAALDGNRDAAQCMDLFRAHDVGFPEVDGFNQGHICWGDQYDRYGRSRPQVPRLRRASRLLAISGASFGTYDPQSRASTGISVTLPRVFFRCSAIAPASSPADASPVPSRNTQVSSGDHLPA